MKPVKGQDMDQEHPHLGALVGGSTGSPMCASPETMDTSLSPHTTTAVQATADNRMSSGAPETGAGNDGSEPRLEDERTDTPASDISSSDVASGLHPSDETQDTANTTEEQTFYKRELRPKRGMLPCTWIDADTTGDFDPREEAHKARPRRKKVKTSHRGNHDWNGEGHTNEPAPELETRTQPPPALCIRFNSSAGKLAYSELCAKLDREVKPPRDNWTAGYQLRKRKSISHDPFSGTLGVQATGVRVIASELLGDFTNHPVARGCFDCLAIGSRCSLLDNEHSWPCEECKDNDNDCQLVKEPKMKTACTHCQYLGKRQKWLVCSFEYNQDPSSHRGRCVECQEDGHNPCIAGPKPGHVPTRKRIGWDGERYIPLMNEPSINLKASRKTTCLQCLECPRVCSFNAGALHRDGEVCTACDMAGEACEPLGTRILQHRHQRSPQESAQEISKESDVERDNVAGVEQEDVKVVSTTLAADQTIQTFALRSTISPEPPADSLELEQADAKIVISLQATPVNNQAATTRTIHGPYNPRGDSPDLIASGTPKTVRTKLCHPVRFDYRDPTRDGSNPCHFCTWASYSVLGLPERTVEVIEWDDGRGWEEMRGGHRAEGSDATQVCPNCTMVRMKIMVCDQHALRRISGVDDKKEDLNEAMNRLVDEKDASDMWCSVCCNLATQECCLEQQVEDGEGCGLALCDECASDLRTCEGSLEPMLQQLKEGSRELRADYELLKQDGLLMDFLRSSADE